MRPPSLFRLPPPILLWKLFQWRPGDPSSCQTQPRAESEVKKPPRKGTRELQLTVASSHWSDTAGFSAVSSRGGGPAGRAGLLLSHPYPIPTLPMTFGLLWAVSKAPHRHSPLRLGMRCGLWGGGPVLVERRDAPGKPSVGAFCDLQTCASHAKGSSCLCDAVSRRSVPSHHGRETGKHQLSGLVRLRGDRSREEPVRTCHLSGAPSASCLNCGPPFSS